MALGLTIYNQNHYSKSRFADAKRNDCLTRLCVLIKNYDIYYQELDSNYYVYGDVALNDGSLLKDCRIYIKFDYLDFPDLELNHVYYVISDDKFIRVKDVKSVDIPKKKDLLPDAGLESYRGKDSEYWVVK